MSGHKLLLNLFCFKALKILNCPIPRNELQSIIQNTLTQQLKQTKSKREKFFFGRLHRCLHVQVCEHRNVCVSIFCTFLNASLCYLCMQVLEDPYA